MLELSLDGRTLAQPVVRPRFSTTNAQRGIAVAIVPMVAITLVLGLTNRYLQYPVLAAVYWGYLIAASMGVGLYWWVRRPASRFGPLLILFGVLAWVVSWQNANAPLAYDLGVLVEAPVFILTFYLFLAFPMGRLEPAAARWLIAAMILVVAGLFVTWFFLSGTIAGAGALTACAHACPENVLQIGSASPGFVKVVSELEVDATLVATAAALVIYGWRVAVASRPQRRALMAVAVTSLLWMPAYLVTNFARQVLDADPDTVRSLAWAIVAARVLLPLGFLIALWQADRFAGAALRTLLERLATRPSPQRWRDSIAHALDDRAFQLGYLDPASRTFREPDGEELEPPREGADRVWVPINRGGEPVAAMVVDETLTEDPELVRAAGLATVIAVQNGALEGELRRQIERDIHDSAQQRLIALRIHLAMAGEQLERTEDRAALERLDEEVGQAIEDLRGVMKGTAPGLLAQAGLAVALEAAAARAAIPVTLRLTQLPRYSPELETAVYFCCVECLQNAAKHAGPQAAVILCLMDGNGRLTFSVEDDGVGFDPVAVEHGSGLANIAERVHAASGTLRIDASPGRGTCVTASFPWA